MVLCFVPGCNHRERCKFHRFPKDLQRRRLWERLRRREDRAPTTEDRVCVCHFLEGDTTPTKFPWSRSLGPCCDPTDLERKITRAKKAKRQLDESVAEAEAASEAEAAKLKFSELDHSYAVKSEGAQACLEKRDMEIEGLKSQIRELELRIERISVPRRLSFSVQSVKDDEKKMLLYTSLSYETFTIIGKALGKFDLQYYQGWRVTTLSPEDQLFLTLMKLKLSTPDLDLAVRFSVSETTVSNVFYTYIHALHELLFEGILEHHIPSQLKCKGSMPESFAEFGSARLVMDATEITMDIPRRLDQKAQTYSSYKSRHTVKSVLSVAPNAAIVHVSELYPGSTSDNKIVEKCGVLQKLEPGDLVLADKGFTIQNMLPAGVHLNIPPFLTGKSQFTPQEAQLAYKIARASIHVERANERIKNFSILNHIPSHYRSIASKIFQVCAVLVNFQAPLLKEVFGSDTDSK